MASYLSVLVGVGSLDLGDKPLLNEFGKRIEREGDLEIKKLLLGWLWLCLLFYLG